jgi:hypothetical protein
MCVSRGGWGVQWDSGTAELCYGGSGMKEWEYSNPTGKWGEEGEEAGRVQAEDVTGRNKAPCNAKGLSFSSSRRALPHPSPQGPQCRSQPSYQRTHTWLREFSFSWTNKSDSRENVLNKTRGQLLMHCTDVEVIQHCKGDFKLHCEKW